MLSKKISVNVVICFSIVRDLMTGDVDDLRADLEVRMRKNKQLREYR